jgi:hypothetical protein
VAIELASTISGNVAVISNANVVSVSLGGNLVNPSMTTGTAVNVGELLIGAFGYADNPVPTGDSDTLNGTWNAMIRAATSQGTGDLNANVITQSKLQTTTASTQTWNLTMSRTGYYIFRYVRVTEGPGPLGWPQVWTGSAWVRKPVKVWTGSAWVTKPMKRWDGTTWKLV